MVATFAPDFSSAVDGLEAARGKLGALATEGADLDQKFAVDVDVPRVRPNHLEVALLKAAATLLDQIAGGSVTHSDLSNYHKLLRRLANSAEKAA